MTLPGLPRNVGIASLNVIYDDVAQSPYLDVDVWADANSPGVPVNITVTIAAGITLGSTDSLIPAMDFSGFADGSQIIFVNNGNVQGIGGDGGRGDARADYNPSGFEAIGRVGGGGGGGAGTNVGLGAHSQEETPSTWGLDGSATEGGIFGQGAKNTGVNFNREPAEPGLIGGNAIRIGAVEITITNIGFILAGGGGGGGGGHNDQGAPRDGGAGGGPALAGNPGVGEEHAGLGGDPGLAIQIDGTTIIWISGDTPPNLEGAIGA